MAEFWQANEDLAAVCAHDDAAYDALFGDNSRYGKWRKRWFNEILPVVFYARNLGIFNSAQMRIAPDNAQAVDIEFKYNDVETRFEVTVAELALHPRWQEKNSHYQPGAQAAAIQRRLRRDGFVEPYNPIDGKTLEPFHEARGDSPESRLEACVNGLQFALNGKARGDGYGRGSTLLVYGREFPHFLRCSKSWGPCDLLSGIEVPVSLREFDRVLLIADGQAWSAEIVGYRQSGREERGPE